MSQPPPTPYSGHDEKTVHCNAMLNPFDRASVTVVLRWHGKDIRKEIQIDRTLARCLAPLSKNHDAPFDPWAHRDAEQQRVDRLALARSIAASITNAIMEEAASQDPIRGYTPEENKAFYQPPSTESRARSNQSQSNTR